MQSKHYTEVFEMNLATFATYVRGSMTLTILGGISVILISTHYFFPSSTYLEVFVWVLFIAAMMALSSLAPLRGRPMELAPRWMRYLGTLTGCVLVAHISGSGSLGPTYSHLTDLLLPLSFVLGVAHVMTLMEYAD